MFLGNIVFHDPKEFADPHVSDGLKVISNESMDFNDPKEFDDPQVFNDPKGISIGSVGSDNPKFYCDIFIFDGLFFDAGSKTGSQVPSRARPMYMNTGQSCATTHLFAHRGKCRATYH